MKRLFLAITFIALATGTLNAQQEWFDKYKKLLNDVEKGLVFSSDGDAIWQCANCGHIVVGRRAPEMCPICGHPKAYFMKKGEGGQAGD